MTVMLPRSCDLGTAAGQRAPRVALESAGRSGCRDCDAVQALSGLLVAASLGCIALSSLRQEPAQWHWLRIDRVTSVVALLVSGIGAVALRYAIRCMDGHPRRSQLLGWMAFTGTAAWILALADPFPLIVGAWIAVGLGVRRMLVVCGDQPGAAVAARRMTAFGFLGDALLAAACVVGWWGLSATSISSALAHATAEPVGPAVVTFMTLACCAAIVKSAQVPLHGWLPDTVGAPTPVSALMHAGIVNAGGVLLIRLAPVIERVPEAWLLLSLAGTASILVAAPTAWVQARAKTALAWSTVSQMGFMLVQCGACAFPAALLHILGHGTYKAWAFLKAGEVPVRTAAVPPALRAVMLLAAGTALSVPPIAGWLELLGMGSSITAGKLALLGVVAIATGQCWVALLGVRRVAPRATALRIAISLAITALLPGAACILYVAASWWTGMPIAASGTSPAAAWLASAIPVAAIALLAIVHALMPTLDRHSVGMSLRAHALSGFYIAIVVGRALDRVRLPSVRTLQGVDRA